LSSGWPARTAQGGSEGPARVRDEVTAKESFMALRKVYFNGEFVSEQEARVSIFDSALMFGDMVFEMTRTYRQTPFRLRAHLERIYAGLRYLDIDCGLTLEEMEETTLKTLEINLP